MINMLVKTWSLTMNNARNIRIKRKQAETSLHCKPYSRYLAVMDYHGLSWMTFMDDFHEWLSWMTFMDFTYWLWTDRLKDRHCYCDWKCVTACYYLNEGYNTFLNKISLILQSKLSPIMHLLCSTITLLQTTISFKIIQTDLIYSTHTMLLLTLIKLCPF